MKFISLKTLYKTITDAWDLRDRRTSYVISGMTPTAHGAGSFQVDIAAGTCVINGVFLNYAGGNVTRADASDPTNPTVDCVRFASGAVTPSVVEGTAAAQPVAPALGASDLLISVCFIPAKATDFTAGGAYVEDMTMLRAEITTTKGDIIAADANGVPQRVAVGSNTQVLTADSTQAAGVKWAATGGTTVVITKYQDTTQFSTSSASFVDITSMSIVPNVSNANNNIRYELFGTAQASAAGNVSFQILNSTDTVTVVQGAWSGFGAADDFITSLVSWVTQATGAKTVKGQMTVSSGTGYIGGALAALTTTKGLVSVEYR